MELSAALSNAHLAQDPNEAGRPPLNPGLGLGELLDDLRTGEGFSWLLKGLLRNLGQESTRFVLKRHGYSLGARAAALIGAQVDAPGRMFTLLDALGAHLPVRPAGASAGLDGEERRCTVEWTCLLEPSPRHSFENRINHENALVWLVMGYAAGYLNQLRDCNFHITYARQVIQDEVSFRFVARVSHSEGDFDRDLLLPNFRSAAGAIGQGPTVAPSAQSKPRPRRFLLEDSELTSLIKQVATTDATVMLLGESGVGKSVVARELHAMSLRAQQSFVEINCAAVPEQLFESELFGVERGAFSGATSSRKGKFELAHGGSLFLDEVALLSPAAQSKLLRVLQTGEFERLGSNITVQCDVRVIAATNEPLERLVREGKFREDLYFRLNVFPVLIPPLRERRNEIPGLSSVIIRRLSDKYRKAIPRCSAGAREVLLAYDWPGNIRELENALERAVILCPPVSEIQPAHLGSIADKLHATREPCARPQRAAASGDADEGARAAAAPAPAKLGVDEWAARAVEGRIGSLTSIKDALFRAALRQSNGNLPLAAASLGLTRSQLSYQLRKMEGVADKADAEPS